MLVRILLMTSLRYRHNLINALGSWLREVTLSLFRVSW